MIPNHKAEGEAVPPVPKLSSGDQTPQGHLGIVEGVLSLRVEPLVDKRNADQVTRQDASLRVRRSLCHGLE